MLEVYTFEMLTGRRLTPLPVSTASWTLTAGADETMTCSLLGDSLDAVRLDVWGLTTLARNGLLFVVDGVPVAAGPIWKRSYNQGKRITLTAGGLRSYWERRLLLPAAARTTPLVSTTTGEPDASLNTTHTGLSLGTIAKRYVELAQAWPGAALPMILPADELGTRERTVLAVDVKTIRELHDNLSAVENGPDIAFRPRFASDGLGIEWEMEVGSEAVPRLGNPDPTLTRWTVGAPTGSSAYDLEVDEDGTGHLEEAWALGGASEDRVLSARSRSTVLPSAGFPLLQGAVTGLADVALQSTVQGYADQAVKLGQYAASFWKAKVRARGRGVPLFGDYWLGDLVTITVDPAEPVLPSGDFVRRIASISGDQDDDAYELTFAEAIA